MFSILHLRDKMLAILIKGAKIFGMAYAEYLVFKKTAWSLGGKQFSNLPPIVTGKFMPFCFSDFVVSFIEIVDYADNALIKLFAMLHCKNNHPWPSTAKCGAWQSPTRDDVKYSIS